MEPKGTRKDWLEACKKLNERLEDSEITFNEELTDSDGLWHIPVCTVSPKVVKDVQTIVLFIAEFSVPFAIQSGGRSGSPSFSRTSGLLISLAHLNEIKPAEDAQTVSIGSGAMWEDVYEQLDPLGVTVAGAKVIKIGVGGMILGGGYGWFAQQQGLTVDTLNYIDVVLPDGRYITGVSKTNYSDLFWALKGTGNNFGIAVNFNLFTKPQRIVYGGFYLWPESSIPAAINAVGDLIVANKDVKLQLCVSVVVFAGIPYMTLLLCYDGQGIPKGVLDKVEAVPHMQRNVQQRTMHSLCTCIPSPSDSNLKRTFAAIPMKDFDPKEVMKEAYDLCVEYGGKEEDGKAEFSSFSYEPMLPQCFKYATDSAFPHSEYAVQNGCALGWYKPENDIRKMAETREFAAKLRAKFNPGHAFCHPNYALEGTDPEDIYGDISRLFSLQEKYDPLGVMALTSGHKFS